MKPVRLFRRICCLLGLCALCIPSPATDLTIVTESFPPLNYEENGKLTGYSTEVVQALLATAEVTGTIQLMPWARAYQTALNQPNTMLYSTTRLPERENLFEWIGPISPRLIYIYKLRSRPEVDIRSLADTTHYKVGLVREMAATKQYLQAINGNDANIDFAPTVDSNMKKFLLGRVDLIISQDWSAAYLLKSLGHSPDEIENVLLLDDSNAFWLALNKQTDPLLLQKLHKAFDKLQQSGIMEKLKHKYMR